MDQNLGTYDFYFEVAERLEALGVDFCITIRHPGTNNIVCLSNLESQFMANKMLEGMTHTFNERFGDPEAEGEGI